MTEELLKERAYLAPRDFTDNLLAELPSVSARYDRLFLAPPPEGQVFWAQNEWIEPRLIRFDSIGEAAQALRDLGRNWALYPFARHRRALLIKEKLPFVSDKPKRFPMDLPRSPMGGWTLIDDHLILASPRCSSPFPNGEINLEENKLDPPSRAYLKLEEALTLAGTRPGPGSVCVDSGATPGGWTWVLQGLGAQVTAVDRADLDPKVAALPGVRFLKHSAFTLRPEDLGPCDWLVSDVICYPPKLLEWIQLWLESGLCRNFVCTIKMQGEPDMETTRAFARIPGSRVVHLSNNKHELTWILAREGRAAQDQAQNRAQVSGPGRAQEGEGS
jgi:23S rRNA (cytidine2498-2'-O)-methyltransferase